MVGDELWFHYSGRTYRHDPGQGGADNSPEWGAIGLARIRLDGFASLDASFDGGVIETRSFVVPAGELLTNAKADVGELLVQVLGPDGQPREGYRSEPVRADGLLLPVKWAGGARLADLRGQTISLRLELRNAQLYAFRIGEGSGLAYLSGPR